MKTPRPTRKDRLEAAGYTYVAGWLPNDETITLGRLIEAHRSDVERIAETKPPRGRPKRETKE
jgi:hypothetical protein